MPMKVKVNSKDEDVFYTFITFIIYKSHCCLLLSWCIAGTDVEENTLDVLTFVAFILLRTFGSDISSPVQTAGRLKF